MTIRILLVTVELIVVVHAAIMFTVAARFASLVRDRQLSGTLPRAQTLVLENYQGILLTIGFLWLGCIVGQLWLRHIEEWFWVAMIVLLVLEVHTLSHLLYSVHWFNV
jgi:hypothetical protein